jgi:hypothetical protein
MRPNRLKEPGNPPTLKKPVKKNGREAAMSEPQTFPVPQDWARRAYADKNAYRKMYEASIDNPEGFWREHGQRIDWIKPYTKVKNVSYDKGDLHIRWFEDGTLNASANCIDRHLAHRADKVAIIWEGDEPTDDKKITYRELHEEVCKFANVLKAQGIKKGDRVTIYMPMIPEAAYAMLACARIGAVHSVVFGGFSPDSLAGRIEDGQGAGKMPGRQIRYRREAHGRRCHHERRPRHLVRRCQGQSQRRLPARGDERRGPAFHPLYERFDRQAQGRDAHHWRLHGLYLHDPSLRLRLSR